MRLVRIPDSVFDFWRVTMNKRCYYEVLGCKKGAPPTEIKAAYRKLAMELHPDRNPGDHTAEVKFKELNEAYDVLKDDQKRAAYDRFGHAAFEHGMGNGHAGGHPFDFAASFTDVFDDLFGEIMGGGRRAAEPRRRPALQSPDHAGRSVSRPPRRDQSALRRRLRSLRRHRRRARHPRRAMPDLRRPRQGARHAGLLHHRAHLPAVPRQRAHRQEPVQALRRHRPRAEGTHAGRRHSAGRRGRHAHPPFGRRPGRLQRRPAGRPLCLRLGHPARDLPARRPRSLLPRAGVVLSPRRSAAAWTCPRSTAGAPRSTFPKARNRAASSACAARACRCCAAAGWRGDLYIEIAVETPVKLSKKQKDILREFEGCCEPDCQPECGSFFAKVKDFWDSATAKH